MQRASNHKRKEGHIMADKPKLHAVEDPPIDGIPPDPFNLDELKLGQDFEAATGVRKLLTTVPVRKPGRQEWIRVHPGENYRATFGVIDLKADSEFYLLTANMVRHFSDEVILVTIYTAINKQGVLFLWPARLPTPNDRGRVARWYSSAIEAAELAMKRSVRVKSNLSLGAYETTVTYNPLPENDPVWPDLTFQELLRIGFQKTGCFVDNFDHPIIKQLRGL
jgi:hypothetical protein